MPIGEQRILILGDESDPHTKAVTKEIVARGAEVLCLDVWTPWTPVTGAPENEAFLIGTSGGPPVTGLWVRLKPRFGGGLSESQAFALRERREFLFGIAAFDSMSANCINDPLNQDRARNKLFQLRLAHKLGLRIPTTIVSNDPSRVADFAKQHDYDIIYKSLSWLATMTGEVLFTQKISREEISAHTAAISRAPGIYQKYIPKQFEYRVTCIDDNIFSVRIHSQELAETTVDWRRNQEKLNYTLCELPDSINSTIRALRVNLGLRYMAVDLIEDVNGDYVFLETNPAGNWLWLEERLGIPISSKIADALLLKRQQ